MAYVARHLHGGPSTRMAVVGTQLSTQYRKLFAKHGSNAQRWTACCCRPWTSRSQQSSNRLSRLSVRAAWGDDIVWSPAKIVKTQKDAEGFHTILLDVGAKAAKAYTKAGQYVQVRLKDKKPGFYAIASSPQNSQDGMFELLIRRRGENSEQLCSVEAGTEVEASPVDGPGFLVDKIGPDAVSQVFIFATGSGIAPIKALIESGSLQADKRKLVDLYWGTQSAEATPFQEAMKGWEAAGVKINNVYSKDGLGYVQDVFEQENAFQDGSKVGVLLCGQKVMSEMLTNQMTAAGVKKERILTNY